MLQPPSTKYSLVPCPAHNGETARPHLMSVVATEAAGGADARVAGRHAGEAGEDGLALEVAGGVGAVRAVVAAQNQIRLLGFRRRTKMAGGNLEPYPSRNGLNRRVGGGEGRYQLIGLNALDVLLDGDGGLRLVRERVAAVSGHGPGVLGLGFRGAGTVGGAIGPEKLAGRGNGGGQGNSIVFPWAQVSVKLFVPTFPFPPRRIGEIEGQLAVLGRPNRTSIRLSICILHLRSVL
jgi:hypothetical protein